MFAIYLGWFDASGWFGPNDRVLPSFTLGMVYAAYVARLTRAGMLDVLSQDYIGRRAPRASESRISSCGTRCADTALIVDFLRPTIAGIVTGSFVIETIFQIPGAGQVRELGLQP